MDNFTQFKRNRSKLLLAVRCLPILATIFICSPVSLWAGDNSTPSLIQQINEKLVTLNFTNKPLKDILLEIKKQTNIGFVINVYVNQDELKSMSITAKNESVANVLNKLLKNTNCEYKIVQNEIVITSRKASTQKSNDKLTINGTVIDADTKKPIVGATIIILGTSNGAISDDGGKFSFSAQIGQEVEISYIGMKGITKKITANDATMIIEMQKDAMAVDDVIVTGIFKKSKESYTGAVTSVTSKDLKMYRGQNVLATLKNIDPSLNVVSNNNFGSDPNRLPEVNIRGNSSLPTSVKELNEGAQAQLNAPLIIMDGFEISLQKLMDYNDDDIENINILKDAAATAIYGSRGANGVIVIITKTPVAGKLRINISGGISIEIPDLSSYDLMNAREKLTIEREVGLYSEKLPTDDKEKKDEYYRLLKEVARGVDTDWISQPIRTGIGQTYNIGLSGGNQEFRWMANARYNNTQGAMKDSERDNFNSSITLAYSLKNVIFRNQLSVDINRAQNSKYGKFSDYVKMNPYWRIYDENEEMMKYYTHTSAGFIIENPLYNSSLDGRDESRYTQLTNNFSIEWDILESLKLRGALGLSKQFNRDDLFYPADHTKFVKYKEDKAHTKGEYQYNTGEDFNYDGNITLTYSKTFAEKHQVYVGFDYSISQKTGFGYEIKSIGFPSERLDFFSNGLGYEDNGKPIGNESKSRRVGFTGNANYTYDNRYFADFSYRMDGSSQFGTQNRFAPFWSFGLGWNLHREAFLTDSKAISNLRIRGSIGETGSQQFNSYQALSTLRYYTDKRYAIWNSAELMGLGNENLKWQTTRQLNGGIEIGLWANRISGSLDVYSKTTKDLLSQMDIQLSHGFPSYMENIGEVKNTGFEAMLSGYLIRNMKQDMIWTVTGKIAYTKNEITKLSDAIKLQTEEYLKAETEINKLLYEGRSQNSIYAVRSLGIDPSNGKEIFLDKDGNIISHWRSSDKVYMGVADPKYRGNISTMFSYKGVSLNLSFGYHFGGQQYNETLMNRVEVSEGDLKYNADRRVFSERWRKAGDIKFYKGIDKTETKATSRFVMDDNMFELQSANIQYLWNTKGLQEKTKFQSVTFGINMSDMFYISSIKRERGLDYPFARRVSFTLTLAF